MKRYWKLSEVVCPHIERKLGVQAWSLIDPRLQSVMVWVRREIDRPVIINNLEMRLTQRGVRCNMCSLVKASKVDGRVYLSPHIFGAAMDFNVLGLTADEVRQWIFEHRDGLPYPVRLERDVTWVHLDVLNQGDEKIIWF